LVDETVGVGGAGRGFQLFLSRLGVTEAQIVLDAAVE
jgi:hypothetical protein